MRATLVITDDAGKKHTVIDKTLTGKTNFRKPGNVTFLTTGFGVPTQVMVGTEPLWLGITLQTRGKKSSGPSSLID